MYQPKGIQEHQLIKVLCFSAALWVTVVFHDMLAAQSGLSISWPLILLLSLAAGIVAYIVVWRAAKLIMPHIMVWYTLEQSKPRLVQRQRKSDRKRSSHSTRRR